MARQIRRSADKLHRRGDADPPGQENRTRFSSAQLLRRTGAKPREKAGANLLLRWPGDRGCGPPRRGRTALILGSPRYVTRRADGNPGHIMGSETLAKERVGGRGGTQASDRVKARLRRWREETQVEWCPLMVLCEASS